MNDKVGIVFQKINQDELNLLQYSEADNSIKNHMKQFMNIEVSMNDFDCITNMITFLNKNWNNRKKLIQLLPLGYIFKLGSTVNNTASEYSKFKQEYRKIKPVDITEHYGDIKTGVYWVTSSEDFSEQSIEIDFYSTDSLDEIIKDSYSYEWKYVIYFDGKEFTVVKENIF